MNAFPGEVEQACTDWERVRADHPKDFSNRASAELSEAELETFETISQQRQTWSSLYSGQLWHTAKVGSEQQSAGAKGKRKSDIIFHLATSWRQGFETRMMSPSFPFV